MKLLTVPNLYDGILVDYELSYDGGLDTVTLAEAHRRKLSDDPNSLDTKLKDPYYKIEGHILLIKYSETKNLNFTYYTLDHNKEDEFMPRKVQ